MPQALAILVAMAAQELGTVELPVGRLRLAALGARGHPRNTNGVPLGTPKRALYVLILLADHWTFSQRAAMLAG
jgi:hypothetical protein